MADFQVNTIATSRVSTVQPGTSATDSARINANTTSAQEVTPQQEETLSNVVAVSEDGDTVQVSENAQMQASMQAEGSVTNRAAVGAKETDNRNATAEAAVERMQNPLRTNTEDNQQPSTADRTAEADRRRAEEIRSAQMKRADEEATQDRQQDVGSLAGYTKMQLDQMYREGKISQAEYDAQMQRRQEQLQASSEDSARMAQTGAALNQAATQAKLDNLSVGVAFSDNSSDTIDASVRLDAMKTIRQAQEGPSAIQARNEERRQWDYQLLA